VNGNNVALDTNQAIAVLNDTDDAGEWVGGYDAVILPVPVIGELRFGALNSTKVSQNLERIEGFVQQCNVLPADPISAIRYAEIRHKLKRAGTPIPENDIWIAAICVQHDLPLATSDDHFRAIEGLRIIWR
jgi:tRNA(fMet)-specific endonuclease VapC